MTGFDQKAFNTFVAENDVYGIFDSPITLKSGRTSHFYANFRTVTSDVWLTEQLVGFVLDFVTDHRIEVDTFYGVPEGASKLAVLTQLAFARQQPGYEKGSHALAMGRGKPKSHGAPQDRLFLGEPRGRIVLLEDVSTTGGSALALIKEMLEGGFNITTMINLANRMERRDDGKSVEEAVRALGLAYHAMSNALDVLPLIYRQLNPPPEVGQAIEEEFREYGVAPLSLVR